MFLDTTFCVDLLREAKRGGGPATDRLDGMGETPLFVSVFVVCELQAGARLSARPVRELRNVAGLVEHLAVTYPDASFPVAYAEAEAALRRRGVTIPTMDLLIGVTAGMRGRPLLTRDVMHYRRIPGLVVETY